MIKKIDTTMLPKKRDLTQIVEIEEIQPAEIPKREEIKKDAEAEPEVSE